MVNHYFERSFGEESWRVQMLRVYNELHQIVLVSRDAIAQSQASIALANETIEGALIGRRR